MPSGICFGTLSLGTIARVKPCFAAAAMRSVPNRTGRISPARPISPKQTRRSGVALLRKLETMESLDTLAGEAKTAIAAADDATALDQVRIDYLGKKGQITGLLKGLGKLSAEERPAAGARINVVKQELQELIGERKATLE